MSALDSSAVNTVLPVIRGAFGSGIDTIQWVVTVYLLVVSGLLLTFGRLGDLRGHKPVYVTGFAVFLAGSGFSALAPSAAFLIGARAVQALGAAMLFANAPAILTRSFPAAERGRALGMVGTMTFLGLTAGPSLGGWVTATWGWRAVYAVNVPIGLAALATSLRFVPDDRGERARGRFDPLGAVTFLVGLVALLLALNQAHAWGWGSARVAGLLAAAAVALASFVAVEARAPSPLLDLGLFRARLFAAASASAVLNFICVYSVIFLMPFYLIQGRGWSPAQAGLVLTAQPLVMAVTAPVSGALSDRIGSRIPSTAAMLILSLGLVLLSRLGADASVARIVGALLVTGLGAGGFGAPNSSAIMGSAPRDRQGIAAAVIASCRNVGMVLGVGLAGAILTTRLARAQGAPGSLFGAVGAGLLAAACVAAAGAAISAVRGGPGVSARGDRTPETGGAPSS
jgi:EmrB/QacA subfamily drug resistance transporter